MHMADALVSPAVGGAMWVAAAGTTAYCARRVREEADPAKVPLMGVLGAFTFAAQMVNFQIPGTGSSGHLGGGLLLAVLLGPHAAFLVISSVLVVQALFFADGGLLALGANIVNLGVFPAFVAYPLVYRTLVRDSLRPARVTVASVAAALAGLMLGSLGVVLQTTLSGISALPFAAFAGVMLPIHAAIGLVEGLVTAAVVVFIARAQPEIVRRAGEGRGLRGVALSGVIAGILAAAVITASGVAWLASEDPDGLEWSIERVAGQAGVSGGSTVTALAVLQERLALMPDYEFRESDAAGTGAAGLIGGAATLLLAGLAGYAIHLRAKRTRKDPPHVS